MPGRLSTCLRLHSDSELQLTTCGHQLLKQLYLPLLRLVPYRIAAFSQHHQPAQLLLAAADLQTATLDMQASA